MMPTFNINKPKIIQSIESSLPYNIRLDNYVNNFGYGNDYCTLELHFSAADIRGIFYRRFPVLIDVPRNFNNSGIDYEALIVARVRDEINKNLGLNKLSGVEDDDIIRIAEPVIGDVDKQIVKTLKSKTKYNKKLLLII